MSEFTGYSDTDVAVSPLNPSEKAWLDDVYELLCRMDSGENNILTLAEIGNACPRSKHTKSKCRKISAMLSLDDRFCVIGGGDGVQLNPSFGAGDNNNTCEQAPHTNFLLYMAELSEVDLIMSEDFEELEKHHINWQTTYISETDAAGNESDLSTIISALEGENKVVVHASTSRVVLETFAGRIEMRLSAIESMHSATLILAQPSDSTSIPGAYSNITGTDYTNVKFLDFDEFELSMFGDTGADHGYELRDRNYMSDKVKADTGQLAKSYNIHCMV